MSIVPRDSEIEWTTPVADDEEELETEHPSDDGVDDDDIDPDLDEEFEGDEFAEGGEFAGDEDDEEEDDEDGAPKPAAKGDEEDDDEPDPDDVEEDLDVILKDRLASGDDLDDEEEDEADQAVVAKPITATEGNKVAPKREDEWTCTGCFLIVSARQFGRKETATCPSGVSDCPSLEML